MTKYKRFMAAVRHLRDYRKQNTRSAVQASMNARRRAERDDGIELDLHSALLALLPRPRRFAMALTRSTVDAEDLVQAAYDRAMSRRAQFRTDTEIVAWMYRVMRTLSVDENCSLQDGRQDGMDTREVTGNSGRLSRATLGAGDRHHRVSGISMRWSSRSQAGGCTCGGRSTAKAKCSMSWSSRGATRPPR